MSRPDRTDDPVGRWLRDLARAAQWHRRLLSAGLLAGAVALAMQAAAPPPPPTVGVLIAARDLAPGQRLSDDHLTIARRPAPTLPTGALRTVAAARGATVVSAVRRGEVLTDVRLLGPRAVSRLGTGLVAAPVRLADAQAAALLRPGDVVDLLAAGAVGAVDGAVVSDARLVASAVRVVTVPSTGARRFGSALGGTLGDGALIVVATTATTAARLAGAAVTDRISLVLRGQ